MSGENEDHPEDSARRKCEAVWNRIVSSVLRGKPDIALIVHTLRLLDEPLSPALRDMLAEMLDPAGPGFHGRRLVFEGTPADVRPDVLAEYERLTNPLIGDGVRSDDACRRLGRKHGRGVRTIQRWLAEARAHRDWAMTKIDGRRERRLAAWSIGKPY